MKISRILFAVVSVTAVYYLGVAYRKWQNMRDAQAQVEAVGDFVILYDFMGARQFPVEGKVLESKSGYVKVRLPDGQIYEHSGRYSIITK